jgi:hypothetical protein
MDLAVSLPGREERCGMDTGGQKDEAGQAKEKRSNPAEGSPLNAPQVVARCLPQFLSFRRTVFTKSARQRIYHKNGLGVS